MSRCGSACRGRAVARCQVIPLGESGVCHARMTIKADRYGGGGGARTTLHAPIPTRADSRGPLTEGRSFHNPRKKRTASKNTRSAGTPYPFEGRPQANEGDDARTKRALADIGVGAMLRDERSKRCPPKCFSSLEMPLDRAGCVISLARGCVERSRLGDRPGVPQALDAQAFGDNPHLMTSVSRQML